MNSRTRFLSVMQFKPPDVTPLPCLLQCFEAETLQRWYREGLRRDAHLVQEFGFERMELAPVHVGPLPALESADVEQTEEWRAGTDRLHEGDAMGRFDAAREQYPLRERADWPAMRARLNPASPARYPRFWEDYRRGRTGRDYPLGIQVTEPFSMLRDWMGLRRLSMVCQTERSWIEEMVAYLGSFFCQTAGQAVRELNLDFVIVRAPWAYRTDAVGGAGAYARLFQPYYREVAAFLHAAGVSAVIVLAKGRVGDLIPFWLESGVNGLGFLEVSAGLDALSLRARYGRDLALIGGLDHHALACQWRDIADEVQAKVPALLSQGGYFPTVDRPMPGDVSLENYEYYLALLRRLGGESVSVADIEEAVRTGVLQEALAR